LLLADVGIVRNETALVREPEKWALNHEARRMSRRGKLRLADALVHPVFGALIGGNGLIAGRTVRVNSSQKILAKEDWRPEQLIAELNFAYDPHVVGGRRRAARAQVEIRAQPRPGERRRDDRIVYLLGRGNSGPRKQHTNRNCQSGEW